MKRNWIPLALLVATILGCGGSSVGVGSIAGLVLDMNGNPVRGARVFVDSGTPRETYSNTSGSYRLTGVNAEDLLVKAEYDDGGTVYVGQNLARVFDQSQSANMTIVLIPSNQVASISGVVTGTGGIRIQGARISAKPTNGTILSSVQTIADGNGNYTLGGLAGGVTYQIQATFPGWESGEVQKTPSAGIVQTVNFQLGANGDPILPAPSGMSLTAWTSPAEVTRDVEKVKVYDGIKKLIDKRYNRTASSRLTSQGNPVEVQLYWDKFDSLQILGYEIWRQRSTDSWNAVDFLRDPLAETYLDSDINLRDGVNYSYSIAPSNTNYPNTDNSYGDFSSTVSVTPLSDMNVYVPTVAAGQVTFHWQAVTNAATYTIYVFDEYPGLGVSSYDNNYNNPATGTDWTYNLTPLAAGHRYYYLIMGSNSDDSARTLSAIGSFIAP
ncbi:MAG: hypothetical protein GC165_06355 [Armatimonadetes bacterium]|nr:hypothetical protein [Armatimonadota bacterium]